MSGILCCTRKIAIIDSGVRGCLQASGRKPPSLATATGRLSTQPACCCTWQGSLAMGLQAPPLGWGRAHCARGSTGCRGGPCQRGADGHSLQHLAHLLWGSLQPERAIDGAGCSQPAALCQRCCVGVVLESQEPGAHRSLVPPQAHSQRVCVDGCSMENESGQSASWRQHGAVQHPHLATSLDRQPLNLSPAAAHCAWGRQCACPVGAGCSRPSCARSGCRGWAAC